MLYLDTYLVLQFDGDMPVILEDVKLNKIDNFFSSDYKPITMYDGVVLDRYPIYSTVSLSVCLSRSPF